MIVGLCIVDVERDRDDVEKSLGVFGTGGAKVIADVEAKLMLTCLQCITCEQRLIGATIGVSGDRFQNRGAAKQFDLQSRGGFAVGGV